MHHCSGFFNHWQAWAELNYLFIEFLYNAMTKQGCNDG